MDWSPCGRWLLAGGRDTTARVFSRDPVPGFQPPTLSGHREKLVACFWGGGLADGASRAQAQTEALAGATPATCYTLSRDGALFIWTRAQLPAAASVVEGGEDEEAAEALGAACGSWRLTAKHFFHQAGAKLSCAALHCASGLLCSGFSHGVFMLHRLPDFEALHTLSISQAPITSCCFGSDGAWVALGCAKLGQLLVWEWRSETYVLKQQGHYYDVNSLAYSPDGSQLVTGADDAKVKVWSARQGVCFVTFKEHSAPVSAVVFAPSGHCVLSASLDGTVRAFDLVRYRNFRTLTAPTPCQFASLAMDPAGEVVAAGCRDTFCVCVWSLKTGRLLDVLQGHEGPVVALAFSPCSALLASGAWDKTVRLWDVFEGAKGAVEALPHAHEVLALAFRPDGKQLATASLDGCLFFWSAADGTLQGSIEGRRDAAGGAARGDKRGATSASSGGKAFTSLCYSADGQLLLAGGNSKHICLYDVQGRCLLRRFPVSASKAVDGVLEALDGRLQTDAGHLDLLPGGESDSEEAEARRAQGRALPGAGAAAGAAGGAAARGQHARSSARVKSLRLCPTGSGFAAATPQGVLVFSLDRQSAVDPSDLGEAVTPQAALAALAAGAHSRALALALRLNDAPLLRAVIEHTPPQQLRGCCGAVPEPYLARFLAALAETAEASPHVEHVLAWTTGLCAAHGRAMQARAAELLPACRALTRALSRLHEDLAATAGANVFALSYLCQAPLPAAPPSLLPDRGAAMQVVEDEPMEEEEEEP